jgi:hypothetical protein
MKKPGTTALSSDRGAMISLAQKFMQQVASTQDDKTLPLRPKEEAESSR